MSQMATDNSSISTTGDTIQCAGCGKASSNAAKFCGGCGGKLWEPCAACEQINAIDLKFCGGCGGSLAERLAEAVQAVEAKLVNADQLAINGRYSEAVGLLKEIRLVGHRSLSPFQEQIDERLNRFEVERETALEKTAQVTAETKQRIEEKQPRAALQCITQIPPALRGQELRALHESLTTLLAEADRLRAEVKQGMAAKNYLAIYGPVMRLHDIEPHDKQIAALAAKLESQRSQIDQATAVQQLKRVLKALKSCDYRAADAALATMPEIPLDDQATQTLSGARERVWLALHLARAPYVDQALIAAAERFCQLQSHDEKAAELLKQLKQRWKRSLASSPGQPIPWNKPGKTSESALGDVLLASTPTDLTEHLTKKNRQPGQFLVAYGLALQSARIAAVTIDLSPKKKSWRDRLSLGGRKRGDAIAWGIDLGSNSLKAVRLELTADDQPPTIAETVLLTRKVKSEAADESEDYSLLAKFMADYDLSAADVTIGLPGTQTLGRFFKLPWLSETKFADAIRYEARLRIPLDPEDVLFGHSAVELTEESEEADAKLMQVAMIGASRKHAERQLRPLAGLKVGSLQLTSECVALVNVYHATIGHPQQAIALVELGADSTNVVVMQGENFWCRGMFFGAESFDKAVAKALKVERKTAEEKRRLPSKAAWMHEIDKALLPAFEKFAESLERTLDQIKGEADLEISAVYLAGGASYQQGLLHFMRAPR